MRVLAALALIGTFGCRSDDSPHGAPQDPPQDGGMDGAVTKRMDAATDGAVRVPEDSDCAQAAVTVGMQVCVHNIDSRQTFESVSITVDAVDQDRTTKYFVPVDQPGPLDVTFMDVNFARSHLDFMRAAWPLRFGGLDVQQYYDLVLGAERALYVGDLSEYLRPGDTPIFGYTVASTGEADGAITCADIEKIHRALEQRFAPGPLAAVPSGSSQQSDFDACDVPIHDATALIDYEAYHVAVGYGRLRRYNDATFDAAHRNGEFGYQDVLVMDSAPVDLERIIGGAVTGARQSPLSHLNVRSASHGTPNCYYRDAYELLAQWEGLLVRMECAVNGLRVREASEAEAQAHFDGLRPDPLTIPPPDLSQTALVPLLEVPTADAAARAVARSRFGAKASNLAALYQRIDPQLQLAGFALPFFHYDRFINSGSWNVDLGNGVQSVTFADTIQRMGDSPGFQTDPVVRRALLVALRAAMRASTCDSNLIDALRTTIVSVFGSESVMVRFRSSSNAEDGLHFNGAGIYDSTSACSLDEFDADTLGPSACDADQLDERDLCRALLKVWASAWRPEAYEERQWYGIDHTRVAMGILVNTRTKSELANIVAFTGNPVGTGAPGYLVNAQQGELDVVASMSGVWPEQVLLSIVDGQVDRIDRLRGSSEVAAGMLVLDDTRLRTLGAFLAQIELVYPVDSTAPPGGEIMLDTEWKITQAGQLIIKQVRPFLDVR